MDQQTIDLITKTINEELQKDGFNVFQRIQIWETVHTLIDTLDSIEAPIHNALFVVAFRSLARALELINSLRKPNGNEPT